MRCHICDCHLSPDEIEFEHDHGNFAPCYVCRKASEDKPEYDYDPLYDTPVLEPEFDDKLIEEVSLSELRLL